MKRISKFGATALAMALSITLIAPISANASYWSNNEDDQIYDEDQKGQYGTKEDGSVDYDSFTKSSTTWTNRVNKKGYTENAGETRNQDAYDAATTKPYEATKKLTVGVSNYLKFKLTSDYGEAITVAKVKSGKGNITLKQIGKSEAQYTPNYDEETKQYYYPKKDGTKEILNITADQADTTLRTKTTYTYALYGKKVGSAVITYKLGGKKQKIKVTVVNDARAFKSVTYAGKSLQLDYSKGATNDSYYAKGTANKGGISYVTAKKGKFKVTPNKNYKVVAVYVVTDTDYETKTNNTTSYNSSYIVRKTTPGIDLNMDGDFEDTINGLSERYYSHKNKNVQKIKNGKKLTLSKSVEKTEEHESWTNSKGTTEKFDSTYKDPFAETEVIVVYQNKITKDFGHKTYTIKLQVGKNK